MEACYLTVSDARALDKMMVGKLRSMMKGAACKQTEVGVLTPWSQARALGDAEVWRIWRLALAALELAIRRRQWLQHMVKHPDPCAQLIALIFGRMRAEPADALDENGKLTEQATVYAQQARDDVDLVAAEPEMQIPQAEWRGDFRKLFLDEGVADMFCRYDPTSLRQKYFAHTWQPPQQNEALAAMMPAETPDEEHNP